MFIQIEKEEEMGKAERTQLSFSLCSQQEQFKEEARP